MSITTLYHDVSAKFIFEWSPSMNILVKIQSIAAGKDELVFHSIDPMGEP